MGQDSISGFLLRRSLKKQKHKAAWELFWLKMSKGAYLIGYEAEITRKLGKTGSLEGPFFFALFSHIINI
jgi:hypothetical protein